jgi:hypothetical protein
VKPFFVDGAMKRRHPKGIAAIDIQTPQLQEEVQETRAAFLCGDV